MYRKNKIIEIISDLTGPLGPFISFDEYLYKRKKIVSSFKKEDIPLFFQILSKHNDFDDDFLEILVEILTTLGQQETELIFQYLKDFLAQDSGKYLGFDILGELKLESGYTLLEPFFDYKIHDENALLSLIAAAGEIGNLATLNFLYKLQKQYSNHIEIRAEINIAINNLVR